MGDMLPIILGVVFVVSLISLVGVATLSWRSKTLEQWIFVLVSFAAGSMLGAAFLDLIPESLSFLPSDTVFVWVLIGVLVSFAIEKFLFHYHCHAGHKCPNPSRKPKPLAMLNLLGDGLHNFIDGLIIAASFLTSPALGLTTSLAVIAHEIPQEIGDFGVLIHAGFSRKRALKLNFLVSLSAFVGAGAGYILSTSIALIIPYIASFAAGTFIYIGGTDLIPEMHHETKIKRSIIQFAFLSLGIFVVWFLSSLLDSI